MNLLLLWAPLADYTVACMRELSTKRGVHIYLVYQPVEENAPYAGFDLGFCQKAMEYSKEAAKDIHQFCISLKPDAIIMSSWNYSMYRSISKQCRKEGTYVISTFDGQWNNTLKQNIGILVSPFFLKPCIDNFFVPGDRQAVFARKLGYKMPLLGYYTANTSYLTETRQHPTPIRSRNFIFVGRLINKKGVLKLLQAYTRYRQKTGSPWGLVILGKGPLEALCREVEGVQVEGFKQPNELISYFECNSCFILPSDLEPWGLVLHEAAIAGLPLISSYKCGATTYFLRDGQNGYLIDNTVGAIEEALVKITNLSDQQLNMMSQTSRTLGKLWTTEKWAEYVYTNINCILNEDNL